MIVQKNRLHFAVHHNAQRYQDGGFKNYNKRLHLIHVCVCVCVETHSSRTVTLDTIVSKKPTYKTVNLILLGESSNLYKWMFWLCVALSEQKERR